MFVEDVQGVVQFEVGVVGGEIGYEDVCDSLDGDLIFLVGVKYFYYFFVYDFYFVYYSRVVYNEFKEFRGFGKGVYLCLIRVLIKFVLEGVKYQFGW